MIHMAAEKWCIILFVYETGIHGPGGRFMILIYVKLNHLLIEEYYSPLMVYEKCPEGKYQILPVEIDILALA